MANKILTGTDFINNRNTSNPKLFYQDTNLLAELFQLSHQYYAKQSILNEQSFIAFLEEFVESIEPICKENTKISSDYETYLLQFSHGIENQFWQQPITAKAFFHALASLVRYAVESFRVCHYPETYPTFLHQLELIFNNDAIIQAGKQRVAYLLVGAVATEASLVYSNK